MISTTKAPYEIAKVYKDQDGNIIRVEMVGPKETRQVFVTADQLHQVTAAAPTVDDQTERMDSVKPGTPEVSRVAAGQQLDLQYEGRQRIMGEFVNDGLLCHFYKGMSMEQIITSRGFGTAVRCLRECCCYNAVELVLFAGATRAMQVARFARREQERRHGTNNAVRHLADFISSRVWKGPPQAQKGKA